MSVSSLPEWKQLLLERKRREEEERERRGKEEKEKLASMPAWKRGIIQRRKAKQDSVGDRERERDVCFPQVEVRSTPSDGLSDTDSSATANLGSDMSLSPDPGHWLDADLKSVSQVSVETIVPLHENPFILTQSVWKKGRDADVGYESEIKEKEKEKTSPRGQVGESGRGRDIELKIERFRDLNEEREKERSRDHSQGRERDNDRERWENDKSQWKESGKDTMREKEFLKGRKGEEEKETDLPSGSGSYSPLIPSLRTIRADNIIIIEQDRKGEEERRGRWRKVEKEMPEENHQGKRGMKMDLREILAGKGSVTEIHASEVLIIKPSASPEERNNGENDREDGEMKCSMHVKRESNGRECRTDVSQLREKDPVQGKERLWGQARVFKDDQKDIVDDKMFVERGGRVSQLLSKFGEHPKLPLRSKSSDNFLRPGRKKYSTDEDEQQSEVRNVLPKRSFSFSDRVICAKENGLDEERCYERRAHEEEEHSDKNVASWVDVADLRKETPAKIKLECTRLLEEDGLGKCRDMYVKNNEKRQKRHEAERCISVQNRSEVKEVEPFDTRAPEKSDEEGFMVASIKNTEGISFARRVPIRKERKSRAEIEAKLVVGENSYEREVSVKKEAEEGTQTEAQISDERGHDLVKADGFENTVPKETLQNYIVAASTDVVSPDRPQPSFTECSGLLCTVTDRARDPHHGPEWTGPYLTHSVSSWHTDELLSKIEKIGGTTVYRNESGETAYRVTRELNKDGKKEGQLYMDDSSESLKDGTPRSPKRIPPPGALEIQIPTTVFYVAEEMVERKKTVGQSNEGQDWEGGQGVERRDSWRIGKPLSRIESLREKIRQRELEKLRQREKVDSDGSVAAEMSDCQTAGESYDERGAEIEEEWEAAAHIRKKLVEVDRVQEDTAAQTSMAAFDVTQEVLKMCSQLPVSVPHSQAVRGEEVTSGYATAAAATTAEEISDSSQTSEDEDEPLKHEEEQLMCHRSQHKSEDERENKEHELSEEEEEEYTSALEPTQPQSSSPPHPNSLAAMSRIYNLETVGSRTGLCVRERTVDISPVHLVKVTPHISNAQQGESKTLSGEDICGVQKIQRKIEQFQLKEQEALKSYTSPNSSLRDGKTKRQESPKDLLKHKLKDDVKTQEKDQSEPKDKMSPPRVWSPTSQVKQTITVNPSFLRSQSPENSGKPLDCAPTPASSPSSLSPSQSPCDSPSPTPSPTLFSVRSASGGQVKKGTTITITPKRHGGAGGGGGGTGPTIGSTSTGSTPAATPPQQSQITPPVAEPVKKKYPTVEEIEVIGGYQILEKSSLVKNRGMPKRVKVCFDVDQLEQVYEYPSETSMLSVVLHSHDLGTQQRGEAQVEVADVDGGAIMSKSTRIVGTAIGRGLRVDDSCPSSSSPNLPL